MRAIAPYAGGIEIALARADTDQMIGGLPLHSQLELLCTKSYTDTYVDSSETP